MRVSPDGGTPERIVALDNADEVVRSPQLLPDGRTVLFTVATAEHEVRWANAEIAVQSTTGPRRTIVRGAGDAQYVASGHIVYTRDGGLMAAPFDAARQQLLGPAVPVLEGVARSISTNIPEFSVSDNGTLMYVAGGGGAESIRRFRLVTVNETGGIGRPAARRSRVSVPARIARLRPADVRHRRWQTGGRLGLRDVRRERDAQADVRWAKPPSDLVALNGQWIAFQSDRESDRGIFRQRADGTGAADRLTTAAKGTSHVPQSWSPAGDRLLFSINTGGALDAWNGPQNPGMSSTLMLLTLKDRSTTAFAGGQSATAPPTPSFRPTARGSRPASASIQPRCTCSRFRPTVRLPDLERRRRAPSLVVSDGRSLFYVPGPDGISRVNISTRPFSFGAPVPLQRAWLFESPVSSRNIDTIAGDTRLVGVVSSGIVNAGLATRPQIEFVLNWFEELKRLSPVR